MRTFARVSAALLFAVPAVNAADIEAGKAKAIAACAACHGASGVSVNDVTPNLAAQRARYLEGELKDLKDGSRKSPAMNPIAAQLSPEDIANVAAYFSSLPGAASGTMSELLPNFAKTRVAFPEGYQQSFRKYHTMNFPATNEVRYYYANPAALKAAREGKALPDGSVLLVEVYAAKLDTHKKPVTGSDGFFETDKIVAYRAMQRDAGWGNDFPDALRNENWHYAIFTAAKKQRTRMNQANCLACHKPLDKLSYTFTLKELAAAK